jgi:hypothetical protein
LAAGGDSHYHSGESWSIFGEQTPPTVGAPEKAGQATPFEGAAAGPGHNSLVGDAAGDHDLDEADRVLVEVKQHGDADEGEGETAMLEAKAPNQSAVIARLALAAKSSGTGRTALTGRQEEPRVSSPHPVCGEGKTLTPRLTIQEGRSNFGRVWFVPSVASRTSISDQIRIQLA